MNDISVIKIGNIYNPKFTGMNYGGNVWDINGLSPALATAQGGVYIPLSRRTI